MRGTLGLLTTAEMSLGTGEKLDLAKPMHLGLFFYTIAALSDPKGTPKGFPSFDRFMANVTTKMWNEMNAYVSERWAELEPQTLIPTAEGEGTLASGGEGEGEKKR